MEMCSGLSWVPDSPTPWQGKKKNHQTNERETPTSSGRYIKPQEKWAPSCDWLENDSFIGHAIM